MNIKILVAAHKKYRMPEDKIYFPVQVGSYGKENIGFARDDEGDNISQKNPYFCELTGLYWIWKNVDADYYGLVHYRRYFSAVPKIKRTSHDKFRYILDEATLENILKDYDIVVPKKRKYFIESLYSHYAHTHYEEHILVTEKVIKEICPDYEASFKKVMKSSSAHMFNMMIMSKEKFNEYCKWLFDILFEIEKRIDITQYDAYQARLFGRISELLLDVWIGKNSYRYKEVGLLYMEKMDWKNKICSFIKAKFGGKKYDRSF